jgi:cell division protease FtsH
MQQVDAEIRRIIDQQYTLARRLIEENTDKMHAMANALLEFETIDAEQIQDIMEGRPPRPPKPAQPPASSPGGGNASSPTAPPAPSTTPATEA